MTTLSAASKACQQQVKRVSSKQKEGPEAVAATKEAEWRAEAERESLAAPEHGAGKYGISAGQTADASCTVCGAIAHLEFRETRDMRKWGAGELSGVALLRS